MNRLDNIIYAVEKFISTTACIITISIVSLEVMCRYCFDRTLMVGVQEIAVWSFIWMVTMGCAALVHQKGHITVEYFVKKFCPAKVQDVIEILTHGVLILFFVVVLVTGYPFAVDQWQMRSTSANIPKTFSYLAIPVSMTFMLVHTITRIVTRIKFLFKSDEQ